jgi:hypothetical protein
VIVSSRAFAPALYGVGLVTDLVLVALVCGGANSWWFVVDGGESSRLMDARRASLADGP